MDKAFDSMKEFLNKFLDFIKNFLLSVFAAVGEINEAAKEAEKK